MSNQLTTDPIKLDSAGSDISTGRTLNIFKSIEWVNPLAVGDRAYLLDAYGYTICDFTCSTPNKNEGKWFGENGQPFDGPFHLSVLDSGYLLISRK